MTSGGRESNAYKITKQMHEKHIGQFSQQGYRSLRHDAKQY